MLYGKTHSKNSPTKTFISPLRFWHNHVLADEGEKEGTVQLISGSGSLPGGSPEKLPEGKFNIESPGFLKLVVKKERNELVGEYTFVDSNNNEVIWEKMKIGQGIRIE